MKAVIALTAFPDPKTARKIAKLLVQKKLAACVNVLPKGTSYYRWKNKLESTSETVLLIKTGAARFSKMSAFLKQRHPYDVPEILAVPVRAGDKDYLKWLNDSLL